MLVLFILATFFDPKGLSSCWYLKHLKNKIKNLRILKLDFIFYN